MARFKVPIALLMSIHAPLDELQRMSGTTVKLPTLLLKTLAAAGELPPEIQAQSCWGADMQFFFAGYTFPDLRVVHAACSLIHDSCKRRPVCIA